VCQSSLGGANDQTTLLGNERAEDETGDRRELHQNINGRSTRVFKGVADGVANDGSLMLIGALTIRALLLEDKFVEFITLIRVCLLLALVGALFNKLFAVIPSATGVGE